MTISEAYDTTFYRCPKIAPIFKNAIEMGWGNLGWIEYRGTPFSTRGNSNAVYARRTIRPEALLGEYFGSRAGRHRTEGYRCFIFYDPSIDAFAKVFPDPQLVREFADSLRADYGCKVSSQKSVDGSNEEDSSTK